MPSKYSIKTYVQKSYYHLYNRGTEKKSICLDNQDFFVLLSYLKTYLEPMNTIALHQILTDPLSSYKDKEKAQQLLRMNNFSESITLLSYCIMPNHYHMLIHQEEMDAIDRFMNSLWTRYTMYFNRKYRRVGPLFQDVYKAVLVTSDEQLLHLSRYIHLNPIAKRHFRNPASKGDALRGYNFCSYQECLGLRHTPWVKPETILNYFGKTTHKSYQDFVEGFEADENTARIIHPVIIEI